MLGGVQHLTTAELEAGLAEVRRSPADAGVVELVVARPEVGVRDLLEEGTLDLEAGLVGDNWGARNDTPDYDRQLNVINARLPPGGHRPGPAAPGRRPAPRRPRPEHREPAPGTRLALGPRSSR